MFRIAELASPFCPGSPFCHVVVILTSPFPRVTKDPISSLRQVFPKQGISAGSSLFYRTRLRLVCMGDRCIRRGVLICSREDNRPEGVGGGGDWIVLEMQQDVRDQGSSAMGSSFVGNFLEDREMHQLMDCLRCVSHPGFDNVGPFFPPSTMFSRFDGRGWPAVTANRRPFTIVTLSPAVWPARA